MQEQDPQIFDLINEEKQRQKRGLELIASEVCYPTSDPFPPNCSIIFGPLIRNEQTHDQLSPYI